MILLSDACVWRALNDIQLLDEFYEKTGGSGAFPSELVISAAANLENFPLLGPVHYDVVLATRGFRKLLIRNYVAVYRIDDDRVVIYRVFDQRSNYSLRV